MKRQKTERIKNELPELLEAVRIALWHHYGETMHKAINKCALASTERMTLLYPLFRLYADESDTYI